MVIIFASLSLLFAGINDMVFKLYSSENRSRGGYVMFAGIVMVMFFGVQLLHTSPSNNSVWHSTLIWGSVAGVFSVLANIALIEGMGMCDVGIASTIYRLNLATGAVLAFVILHEELNLYKILGILSAIVAVILFMPEKKKNNALPEKNKTRHLKKLVAEGVFIIIFANFLRAGMGISYKHGLDIGCDRTGILFLTGIYWIIGGFLYMAGREHRTIRMFFSRKKNYTYGVVSGLLICGIIYFLAAALKIGDASIVLPVSQMSFLLSALLGIIFLKEKLNTKKIFGIGFSVLCVALMSMA